MEGPAEGDAVDLAAVSLVPACDDEAGSVQTEMVSGWVF